MVQVVRAWGISFMGRVLGQDLEDLAMDGGKNEEGEDARGSKEAARVVS